MYQQESWNPQKLSIKNLSSQQFIHHRLIDLEHLNPKPGLLNSPVLPISQDWSIPTSLSSAWVSQNFLVTEPNFGPGMISDLHNDGTYQAVWPKHHGDNHLNNINISWYILIFYKFLTYYITFIKKNDSTLTQIWAFWSNSKVWNDFNGAILGRNPLIYPIGWPGSLQI